MKRISFPTRVASGFLAFVLAFAQVAMAAFAPPARTPEMAQAMAEGMPCHEADPARVAFCIKKNCHDEAQQRDVPSLQPAALAPRTALRVDPPRHEPLGPDLPPSLLERSTSPPPLILFAQRRE